MNQSFWTQIIKAKKIEYEAFRSLLPEEANDRFNRMGRQAKEIIKECVVEFCLSRSSEWKSDTGEDAAAGNEAKSSAKKVTIE